jgi:5-hydroxyisourate hydrolase-like protein (transthyretin family)
MANHDRSQGTPSTLIVGRLIAAGSLRPLPGLTVVARERTDGEGRILRRAHTDADGRFEVCLSNDDLRALMGSASSPPLLQAEVSLSLWNGDEPLGTLSPSIATGPVPTKVDLGDQQVAVPSIARSYTVRTVVVSKATAPVAGVEVVLDAVEIGQRQTLASATTDDDGKVVLGYDGGPRASASDTDRRLQLVVRHGGGELARSPVLVSLRDGQEVRVVAAQDPGVRSSERERISEAIAGPLGAADLGALTLEEIEIVAEQADVYPPHLALLVRASSLGAGAPVTIDELYAMGREGLPLTVAGLLAHEGRDCRRALERAIARKIISVPPDGDEDSAAETIAGRIASWAATLCTDPTKATPRWSNLEHSGVSAVTREAFAAKWVGLTGSPAERWAAVAADPALSAAAPVLEFTAGASLLVGEHGPAVQVLVNARTRGEATSLRDLASWDLAQWTTTLRGAGVPAALDGEDPAAATERLARIAMRVLDVLHPSGGLGRQLLAGADPTLARAGLLLRDHADFDIDRTVPARYFAQHPEAFSPGEAGQAELAALSRVQRVHALAPAIERPAVTQALLDLGLESAGAVVHAGLDGFVDAHAPALKGLHPFMNGKRLAKAVFQQATVRHGAALAMMAQLGKAFQGTPMAVLPAVEWPEDSDDPATATLRGLFGSQDYCACEHCRSVYGPAAYLVDLLALLESRPAKNEANALEVLRLRRPDIAGLELSCANTNTVVPYIDLVLELLEARALDPAAAPVPRQTSRTAAELRLSPEHRLDAAYDLAATAVYPWGLPFDLPTERVRAYCGQLGASRLEAMHTLRSASESEGDASVMDRVAEGLTLCRAALQLVSGSTAYDVVTEPSTAPAAAWGMVGAGWVSTLALDVAQVLERSGLDFDGLREHLALELVNPGQVAQVVFDEPSCDLADARIDGIDATIFNGLQRFVRLSRATGLAPVALDRAVRGLGGALDAATLQELADARSLARRLQQPLVDLLVLWDDFDTKNYADDPSPYAQRFLSRVLTPELDPAFALDASGTQLAFEVPLVEAHYPTIRAALSLCDAELELLLAKTMPTSLELSLSTLSMLARYPVLARALRMPVAELAVWSELVEHDPFASPGEAERFVAAVRALSRCGLDCTRLDYLARHRFSAIEGLDPSNDAIDAFLAALWTATHAVDATTSPADITALHEEALVQGLSAALGLASDATRLLALELVHQGGPLVRDVLLDPTFLDDGAPQAAQRDAYRRLHKAAMVVQTLKVPTEELTWYFGEIAGTRLLDLDALPLTVGGDPRPHVEGLRRVALGRSLQVELGPTAKAWAPAIALGTDFTAAASLLAAHSTWEAFDLEHAMGPGVLGLADTSELRDPFTIARLQEVATLVRRTGVCAEQLGAWVLPPATPAIADALQAALKARYDDATWPQVIAPIADRLRNAQRDALVGYILGRGDFPDATALYDHCLVDPLMGACMLTSRLRLATSSVQLFIQRVLMNLEQTEVTFPPATAERWAWMKSYRVWEANRKVFFYPENWIEPELRDDESPFFEELEQHLQQGELTDAHVEAGYKQYLRKLHEVSHLEVPALYSEQQGEHQVVHVLGRTRGLPPKYWYRTRIDDRVWTPWIEVPVDIPSNQVTLAAHNRRLFVLWVEAQEDSVRPEEEGETDMDFYQRVRIGWTELRDGTWAPKKLTSLSFYNTKSHHRVHAEELQIVAYERSDGALFVDVLYERVGEVIQCTMFRYDDCRDILEEQNVAIHYVPEDLGLAHGMRFDGQRHVRDDSDLELDLLHYKWQSESYQAVGFLQNLPHTYWVTTAKQQRYYMGRTPVVFDDAERAFYIVPATQWVETEREPQPGEPFPVPFEVDPWSVLGGVASPLPAPTPPSEEPEPAELGTPPFGGKVPGMATAHALGTKRSISGGAFAHLGGHAAAGKAAAPQADPHGVLAATKHALEPAGVGNGFAGLPPVPTADGGGLMFEAWAYRIDRFHHPYTCTLLANLNRYGLPGVLAPASGPLRRQLADEGVVMPASESPDPGRDYRPLEHFVVPPYPRDDFDFTPGGAYSVYNWELFVHAPLLIAERLRRERRFEQAQRWYHFVFNPLQGVEPGQPDGPARFWNAKPLYEQLHGGPIDVIKAVMSDEGLDAKPALVGSFLQSILAWVQDPFSPHAIARWRAGTYQKAIVRKYLDNLIEWADSLFAQDTMETVNEATQIYLLAAAILGPRPQRLPAVDAPVRTYDQLTMSLLFGGLTELESFIPAANVALPWMGPAAVAKGGLVAAGGQDEDEDEVPKPTPPVWWAFCLPANDQLLAYWDRVGDRLFKIRNCMNIEGVRRALRLFEPPIDPALLVRAKALGVDLGSALADLAAPAPRHRFAVLRGRAQELLGDVRALGGALLSALEKRDAEALGRLRATHEVSLLRANRAARTKQIEEAEAQLEALRRQQQTVQARQAYYASREAMSALEKQSLALGGKATGFQAGAQATGALAGLLHLIPDLDIGALVVMPHYKLRFGGSNIGPAVRAASDVLGMFASIAQYGASLTSTLAGYQRRKDDWEFQAAQAQAELRQLDTQMAAAELRVAMAKHELGQHDRQVEHSEEVETFLRSKFTGTELYDWMVGQVSGLYFQSYKLAHDMARRAEKALQRELGRDDLVFIEPVYWDGLRKGLLAGERLSLDLRRIEVAQLELDRRELELTKRVSLRLLDPAALLELRETGTCTFSVPEVAFDLDHPGHYFRRIKTVSLSIPAVAGPQVSMGATLTLLEHSTRVSTSTVPAYARQQPEDLRFRDGSEEQAIATSRGRDDAGMFELSLQGEKYLPFEGAGAVSSWRIELPAVRQFDYRTITDVELELRYTARDGGSTLRDAATAAVEDAIEAVFDAANATGLMLLLSATEDFPADWERLLRPAEGEQGEPLELPIVMGRFPYVARVRGIEVSSVRLVFIGDPAAISLPPEPLELMTPAGPTAIPFSASSGLMEGTATASALPVVLTEATSPWVLQLPADAVDTPDALHDLWVLVEYRTTT